MWKILCFTLVVFLTARTEAVPNTPCTSPSDCDAGECCQILSEFQVVSRRQAGSSGTCQAYTPQGGSCFPLDKMNGYCSCEPGTTCTYTPYPRPRYPPRSKRLVLAGIYDCQPE